VFDRGCIILKFIIHYDQLLAYMAHIENWRLLAQRICEIMRLSINTIWSASAAHVFILTGTWKVQTFHFIIFCLFELLKQDHSNSECLIFFSVEEIWYILLIEQIFYIRYRTVTSSFEEMAKLASWSNKTGCLKVYKKVPKLIKKFKRVRRQIILQFPMDVKN
jgi:hypothetical protein